MTKPKNPNEPEADTDTDTGPAADAYSKTDVLAQAAENFSTYPIVFAPGAGPGGGAPSGGGDPGSRGFVGLIDVHLRAILGRVPTGPENFIKALDRSIELYEEEGHTAWRLSSRGSAGIADFGVSGALPSVQGILAQKAREIAEIVTPLLTNLPVLDPVADEDEIDAVRSNLETEFQNLVEELGREQGIRKERADVLFENILGCQENKGTGVDPNSLFGIFAVKAGYVENEELSSRHVTRLEEEQHLADLVVLRSTLLSFRESYGSYLDSASLFFSDELFNLSRALLAINESTKAVEYALDSVLVGEARRRMLLIDQGDNASMKLQDLLDWASEFSGEEAPQILERGGRFGFERVRATLSQLQLIIGKVTPGSVNEPAFSHPRVVRAWAGFFGAVRDAVTIIPAQTALNKKSSSTSTN